VLLVARLDGQQNEVHSGGIHAHGDQRHRHRQQQLGTDYEPCSENISLAKIHLSRKNTYTVLVARRGNRAVRDNAWASMTSNLRWNDGGHFDMCGAKWAGRGQEIMGGGEPFYRVTEFVWTVGHLLLCFKLVMGLARSQRFSYEHIRPSEHDVSQRFDPTYIAQKTPLMCR
jgi:hypothetical protein